jgi:hypothetical protein
MGGQGDDVDVPLPGQAGQLTGGLAADNHNRSRLHAAPGQRVRLLLKALDGGGLATFGHPLQGAGQQRVDRQLFAGGVSRVDHGRQEQIGLHEFGERRRDAEPPLVAWLAVERGQAVANRLGRRQAFTDGHEQDWRVLTVGELLTEIADESIPKPRRPMPAQNDQIAGELLGVPAQTGGGVRLRRFVHVPLDGQPPDSPLLRDGPHITRRLDGRAKVPLSMHRVRRRRLENVQQHQRPTGPPRDGRRHRQRTLGQARTVQGDENFFESVVFEHFVRLSTTNSHKPLATSHKVFAVRLQRYTITILFLCKSVSAFTVFTPVL